MENPEEVKKGYVGKDLQKRKVPVMKE